MDSSRQVNSGQMGPRYLPRATRQAGFAQPRCVFALGRAFPSAGRQQRCQDVTPAALARCLHPGCCCGQQGWEDAPLTVPLTHSLTSHSQVPTDAQGSSDMAKRAVGLQVPSSAGLGGPWPHWNPLQHSRAEGLLLTRPAQAAEVDGRGLQACPGTRAGAPLTQPWSAVPPGSSWPWL